MYNFSLTILILVVFRAAANKIVYNVDTASLYLVNAPVIEGNAPDLNDHNGSLNTRLFTKNTSWVTSDQYEGFVNQSVSIHRLDDGYTLTHIANVVAVQDGTASNITSDLSNPFIGQDVLYRYNKTSSFDCLEKRDDGDEWYTAACNWFYNSFHVKELSFLYNLADSVNSFIADLTTTINNISNSIKDGSKKNSCGSSDVYVLTKDGGQWEFAWSVFKDAGAKNCDTTASASEIAYILRNCINDSEYEHKMAMCIRMDHSGTWNVDVRLQRSWSRAYANIWDMPCGDLQTSVAYDGSECTLIRGSDY
ncbi:Killer toxin KHR [Saccharomyces cerevisiae]|nr:Killer toxin KHR [Saccharomyces cerevisiae]CAI4937058.1 BEM_HP_G0135110.mRNA.1.CDS.1 [Saccharomyces cerevisiae]CAI5117398.1 BEM_HP_G0067740.mRNA.1.CDS.1 [Saccharomyces cerevisiae]CAI6522889.1 BEM_HP_G0135110.mRNA.1.CDS.1 [Saccharomyces cerevisiae]CAI6979865.1 BEM_HP_G0067740.mRNA.1.CDS.1 [Saccharomyces cerevisiae]